MITKRELIEDLRNTASECSGELTAEKYDERGEYSHQTVINRFGGWNVGKRRAGLGVAPSGRHEIPSERLLEDLRNKSDNVDGALSRHKYSQIGEYSDITVVMRFGGWTEAKIEAGLEVASYNQPTPEDDLLNDIKDVSELCEGDFSARFYEEHGEYSYTTVRKRFGDWETARKLAGLKNCFERDST